MQQELFIPCFWGCPSAGCWPVGYVFTTMTTLASITLFLTLADTALLGGGELHSFLGQMADKLHFEIAPSIILGLEDPRGTTTITNNVKLLVDLVMGDLVHQVLNSGIILQENWSWLASSNNLA